MSATTLTPYKRKRLRRHQCAVGWREAVQGVVIKRDEDHLTVRGRVVEVGADEVTFSHFEDVTVDPNECHASNASGAGQQKI